jgi:hypothetical protein
MAGNCTYPKLTPALRASSNARRATLPSLVPPLTGDQTLPVSGQDHHGSDRALASRLLRPRDCPLPHPPINPASAKGRGQRFNARIHEPRPFSPRFGLPREHLSAAFGAAAAAAVAVLPCVRGPCH